MDNIIAYLELVDLAEGDDRLSSPCVLTGEGDAMVTFENLMIGIAAYLQAMIHKSFVQRSVDTDEGYPFAVRPFAISLKDRLQAIELFLLLRKDVYLVAVGYMTPDIFGEKVELLMEDRLRHGVERDLAMCGESTLLVQFNGSALFYAA